MSILMNVNFIVWQTVSVCSVKNEHILQTVYNYRSTMNIS